MTLDDENNVNLTNEISDDKRITLEQTLQSYRLLNTPTALSWKQHYVTEKFSSINIAECPMDERKRFLPRLAETNITILDSIRYSEGPISTLRTIIDTLTSPYNKDVDKINRKVIYSTSDGIRPIGKDAFMRWNGFQVLDMDINDEELSKKLKPLIFESLSRYNWFLGVVLSASNKGLHIYTKIQVPDSDDNNLKKKQILYLTNFRHKYSFLYLACAKRFDEVGFDNDDLLRWLDLAMFKPQQGAFIGYDPAPLISTNFFEDFIYVNFDNVEDMGHPNVDWVSHSELKDIFKRWEWFEDLENKEISITIQDAPERTTDTHSKIHYKHNERWRLANTLVQLYGKDLGYKYLRSIVSNIVRDKELQSDCVTAARHTKPIDLWAVSVLNKTHGFKIKIDKPEIQEEIDLDEMYESIKQIDNPVMIVESKNKKIYNIKSNEYLGSIKNELLRDIGHVTLIEAGAGVGKTEMVKSLVSQGKKVLMVMPFTSTIKSKVEGDDDWYFAYGNRKVRFDMGRGVALTIDKFSKLSPIEIHDAAFDYVFIDESHLLFQSEYRPVMPKVIDMIRNSEVPIIMMSGTPVGETVFFPDLTHLRVIKEDSRKKSFVINITDTDDIMLLYMCRSMARDISMGRKVLFPTNKGTIYKEQISALVKYFLEIEFFWFTPIEVNYYKKSNSGEEFMDDINKNKTIGKTDILLCSNYLSVGVDINDKYEFAIYINDQWMPQEIEQFANRLRSNDLYINMYVSRHTSDGEIKPINRHKDINLKLNEEEMKSTHAVLRLCNAMIERNPVEYKYNSLISNIITVNKFVEYNEIENKYYLNETAYKIIMFERKYRDYVEQLPVIAKGMINYGYEYESRVLGEFKINDSFNSYDAAQVMKKAKETRRKLNADHTEELIYMLTVDTLTMYKDVMQGKYEIRKGKEWKEDVLNRVMTVKNIEVFEKVVPLFLSMSKMFNISDIQEIFEYCRDKKGNFNFAAIKRIRLLINILYNQKRNRLDIPIVDFMQKVDEFVDGTKNGRTRGSINKFIDDLTQEYVQKESTDEIKIWMSDSVVKNVKDAYTNMFRCLVDIGRPDKTKMCKLTKIELLWKEKEVEIQSIYDKNDPLLKDFLLGGLLGGDTKKIQVISSHDIKETDLMSVTFEGQPHLDGEVVLLDELDEFATYTPKKIVEQELILPKEEDPDDDDEYYWLN